MVRTSPARHLSLRPTLLVVGCGDVGLRVLALLRGGPWRLLALTSNPARADELRRAGALPVVADLDDPRSLERPGALADAVLHLAPPPLKGTTDPRTRALVCALARHRRVRRLVYVSTTGVYGDCQGAFFDETRPVQPRSDRARRRVHAEAWVRRWGTAKGRTACILRVPGIYALDRPGGDPTERVRRGAPVLQADQDIHTNHIHADDLARICVAALRRGLPQRAYHAVDDGRLKTGEHYDAVADLLGLPRPPRISMQEARRTLSPMQLSFWEESRRLDNRRMKQELKVRLSWPTVQEALRAALQRRPNGG